MQCNPSCTSKVNRSKFGQSFTAVSQRTLVQSSHKKEIQFSEEEYSKSKIRYASFLANVVLTIKTYGFIDGNCINKIKQWWMLVSIAQQVLTSGGIFPDVSKKRNSARLRDIEMRSMLPWQWIFRTNSSAISEKGCCLLWQINENIKWWSS